MHVQYTMAQHHNHHQTTRPVAGGLFVAFNAAYAASTLLKMLLAAFLQKLNASVDLCPRSISCPRSDCRS